MALTACGSRSDPLELHERYESAGAQPVDVGAIVQAEHRTDAPRYLRAAMAALRTLAIWHGTYPHSSLTIVDPAWHSDIRAADAVVVARTPWWSSPAAMAPELATARAVSRRAWSEAADTGALPSWFVDGLVEYSARRVVIPIFQGVNLEPGYAMIEERYFDRLVPRFVRIRLLPEADGDPMPAYRARPRADVTSPGSAEDRQSLVAKTMLTLNTLERWLGQAVFDGALAEFVRAFRHDRPTIADFIHSISSASGQDLSWLLAQTFGGSAVFDYAVTTLSSKTESGGMFETTIEAARVGDAQFTGTSSPRVGPYESGRGISLVVRFADGTRIVEVWDGRDASKTFVYRSRTACVSAAVDPDRVVVLDVHRTNNSRSLAPMGRTAARRWAGRWMLWLEHVLLTYAVFV